MCEQCTMDERDRYARRAEQAEESLARAAILCRLLTIRQIIEAGDDAIKAAGLNPYCLNEGADPNERFDTWLLTP